jgi:hypothetical protein
MYAKILYYIHGYNLFEACFVARVNRKNLPQTFAPMLTWKPEKGLNVLLNFATRDQQTKEEIIDAIGDARDAVNTNLFEPFTSPFIKIRPIC